ncbi:MAG: GreA/GreB family elongation factor [Victivallales bacterium]|nr:GreA/GreB family elongation factor [Victivallales bacterium]
MSEQLSPMSVTPELFAKAAQGNQEAIVQLTKTLVQANIGNAEWPANVRSAYEDGLNRIAEHLEPGKLNETEVSLLQAALQANMDAPILRDRYAALAKKTFSDYKDPAGLADALGVRDSGISIAVVRRRWEMLSQTKANAICFDSRLNKGKVVGVDSTTNEVIVQCGVRKSIDIQQFLNNYLVVKDLTSLHTLLAGGQPPARREGHDQTAELENCLAHTGKLPDHCLKSILVPAVMNENAYRLQIQGEKSEPVPQKKNVTHAAVAMANPAQRWDDSRTVLELSERLKNVDSLATPDGESHQDNIRRIMTAAAQRTELVDRFALSFALIEKMAGREDEAWLLQLARDLADEAVVWNNRPLCIETCDKVPGKVVPCWFKVTCEAKGPEFLADIALGLPYRLWGYVEKTLAAVKADGLLNQKVSAVLPSGHVTSDLLYWLWKNTDKEMVEIRNKYLSDSPLLFKALRQEAKGNYLKAQRDLRKALVDDPKFLRQVTLDGEQAATIELIRSIKRLPLLDAGEIQSLLVKIVEAYPKYRSDEEEKRQGPVRVNIERMTSIRSYNRRRAELDHILNVELPANSKAIEEARAKGDLSENAEFTYAKRHQADLNRRASEYSASLNGLRVTDFSDVTVDQVVLPGSTVTLRYNDGHEETWTILGLLDTDSDRHYISYDSALGKAMVGNRVGNRIMLPSKDLVVIQRLTDLSPELQKFVKGEDE